MKYYLGIDGGGTKTVAAVSDKNGTVLLKKTGKSINFYSVGMETARKNLADIIASIEAELGETEFSCVFIGCSALDDEADDVLRQKLCDGVIKAGKIKLHSDVYIALKSVGEAQCPCIAICGTGSMAMAQDRQGNTHITGGWGHILGDEGSAYAIALRALKLCCKMSDDEKTSPLLECTKKHFRVGDFRKIIDIIYSPETTKDVIALFAQKVGELAVAGDCQAIETIKTEAELFADTVLSLLNRTECDVMGLSGSVFKNNEIFTSAFSEKVKKYYPDILIKLSEIPPEESALKLAREL